MGKTDVMLYDASNEALRLEIERVSEKLKDPKLKNEERLPLQAQLKELVKHSKMLRGNDSPEKDRREQDIKFEELEIQRKELELKQKQLQFDQNKLQIERDLEVYKTIEEGKERKKARWFDIVKVLLLGGLGIGTTVYTEKKKSENLDKVWSREEEHVVSGIAEKEAAKQAISDKNDSSMMTRITGNLFGKK